MRTRHVIASVLLLAGLLSATHPTVTSIVPRGARRGTEVTLTIYGARLQSIAGLVLFQKGIEVLEVKPDRSNRATVRIRIAADCALGAHEILVRTAYGLSNLKLFMVGTLPERSEKEPNNSRAAAQKIPLDVTVNGRITAEDLDVFRIVVKKGQRIEVEVEGLRLGDREFDPHLTIHDDRGRKLATVDDTIFGQMDPLASVTSERAGTLFLTIRENARGGANNCFYRLHVGTFPRPLVAFPAGGKPGSLLHTRLIGAGTAFDAEIRLPKTPGLHHRFVTTAAGTSPTPIHLVVTDRDNVLEVGRRGRAPAAPPAGAQPAGARPPGGQPAGAQPQGGQPAGAGISAWYLAGPFANPRDKAGRSTGHRTVYAPEKKLELKATYDGRDGKVQWRRMPQLRDNATHDLRRIVKKSDHAVVYLARTIDAPTARRVLLLFSGDDTVRIWCNGKLVLDDPKPSRVVANQHRLFLDLHEGRNELLVKISNRGGGFGFVARCLDPLRLAGYTAFHAPVALNGIIEKPNEEDRFVFLARRGEQLDFQVVSRRLRSPLDPVASIYCTHDRFYLGNDDTRGIGLDSLLRFRAPFTGEFVFRVRDMLLTAGPRHVYRVEVTRRQSRTLATRVTLPGYRYEWTVSVPKGGRNAIMMTATNLDQGAGVQLALAGLPPGVTAQIPPYTPGVTSVPVVFSAAKDATLAGRLARVSAKATRKTLDLSGMRHYQPVDIVQARNRRTYLSRPIDRLPVAVTKPAPFTLEVAPLPVPIVRNSPLRVRFTLHRAKSYTQPVRVRMLYNPPGISASQVTVPGNKSGGVLNLYANNGARTGLHRIVLVGMGNVQGAPISSSSNHTDLRVDTPWMTASVGSVRTEPGKKVTLPITFTAKKKFQGAVEAQWVGLPRGVECAPLKLDRDTPKLDLPVTIDAKAQPGRHRQFRLRLKIRTDKGWVVSDFRSGEIRIDRPRPKRTGS